VEHCTEADKKLSGQLALLIGTAIRQRNLEDLRAAIRKAGTDLSDADARWMFTTVQRDLPEDCKAWFDAAIAQIQRGSDGESI